MNNDILRVVKSYLSKRKTIKGFDKFCTSRPTKRALLSYLIHPFLPPLQFWEKKQFSNRGMAIQMLYVLNELGYSVDIIGFDNIKWRPKYYYDLFIGHGGINFKSLIQNNLSANKKIYFSTGPYWKYLNYNEANRLFEFTERTGFILPPDRYVKYDEEFAYSTSDGIICLGNNNILKTFPGFKRVININNGHFPVDKNFASAKNYDEGRKHFLFFSGRGNIHKGLDLLLEAFKDTDLHLHICQWLEPDFESIYSELLYNQANIHYEGFVSMKSEKFNKLVTTCNWIILPTCAEGQPGSVIECMAYGLIPILSEFANIDLENTGLQIANLDIKSITDVILKASQIDPDECLRKATNIKDITTEKYSAENFNYNFKAAVQKIVSND
jgi:glycosyltransferase involved in cell wall biosynthesis